MLKNPVSQDTFLRSNNVLLTPLFTKKKHHEGQHMIQDAGSLHWTHHSDMKLQQGQPKALKSSDLLKLGLPSIVATKACLNML